MTLFQLGHRRHVDRRHRAAQQKARASTLPLGNGLSLYVEGSREKILKHSPETAVLILSMYSDERYVVRAIKAGARAYVLNNSAGEELIRAIHALPRCARHSG